MDLKAFSLLQTAVGRKALVAAEEREPQERDFLRHLQVLQKRFPRETARAALEIAVLRLEAVRKFPAEIAARMYLTREAMEQSTSWAVAAYRAERFRTFETVFDLGCSVGGDSVHFARHSFVVGVDRDALRLAMARENLRALGMHAAFTMGDLNDPLAFKPQPGQAVFFDPARREGHRRAFSVMDYQPPLSIVSQWLLDWPALAVKISPGVDLEEIAELDCEVEFISENGDLKEAVLWFGPLKRGTRRATVLPAADSMQEDGEAPVLAVAAPEGYLVEPDPAVIRAGLVTTLGVQLGASQLDETIAYLCSPRPVDTPFARFWPVQDWMPFHLKKLRAYCRERNIGRVTVKKRGSPITPEQLMAGLKLKGDEERVLVLTRYAGQPIVIVCGQPVQFE